MSWIWLQKCCASVVITNCKLSSFFQSIWFFSLRSQVSRSFTYVTLVQRLQDERKSVTQSFATSHENNYGVTQTYITNDDENVTLDIVTDVTSTSHEKVPSDGYFQRIINPSLRGVSDDEMMTNLLERWILPFVSTFT